MPVNRSGNPRQPLQALEPEVPSKPPAAGGVWLVDFTNRIEEAGIKGIEAGLGPPPSAAEGDQPLIINGWQQFLRKQ